MKIQCGVLILMILLLLCPLYVKASDGDDTVLVTYVDNNQIYKTEEIPKDSKLVIADPDPQEGYIFKGWDVSDNVSLDCVTRDITVTQKWEKIPEARPSDSTYKLIYQATQISEDDINELNQKKIEFRKIRKSTPKISCSKKGNKITVKFKKQFTNVNIFYSLKKDFSDYKIIHTKAKNGKATVKLKKLKKGKSYYVKASCKVSFNNKAGRCFAKSKTSKIIKVQIK